MNTTIFVVVAVALVVLAFAALALRSRGRTSEASFEEPSSGPAAGISNGPVTFAMLKKWYAGKECALCHRPVPPLHHTGPKPGLMDPSTHSVLTWEEMQDNLPPGALETHAPICPNCETAESFRREFPHLVMDRKDHPHAGLTTH